MRVISLQHRGVKLKLIVVFLVICERQWRFVTGEYDRSGSWLDTVKRMVSLLVLLCMSSFFSIILRKPNLDLNFVSTHVITVAAVRHWFLWDSTELCYTWWIVCVECDSYQDSFLPSRSSAWWRPGRRRREDQEASKNSVFPEEVAAHNVGHLHRRQGARGQQQWLHPRSQPAQVHFSCVSLWGKLGQRAQRHTRLNSDPLRWLKRNTREASGSRLSGLNQQQEACEQSRMIMYSN